MELKNIVIYSKDSQYAYGVRNKLKTIGVRIDYVNNLKILVKFIISKKYSIIFVREDDLQIKEFIKDVTQKERNILIFLDEQSKFKIDKHYMIMVDYDNLLETVSEIVTKVNNLKMNNSNINLIECENYLNIISNSLGLDNTFSGYYYIRECVKLFLGLGETDKKY